MEDNEMPGWKIKEKKQSLLDKLKGLKQKYHEAKESRLEEKIEHRSRELRKAKIQAEKVNKLRQLETQLSKYKGYTTTGGVIASSLANYARNEGRYNRAVIQTRQRRVIADPLQMFNGGGKQPNVFAVSNRITPKLKNPKVRIKVW